MTLFKDYLLFRRKENWYIMRKLPQEVSAYHLKVSKVGLKAFNRIGDFLKPTTRLMQIVGPSATRARMEIDEGQLRLLLSGDDIPFETDVEKGYVVLTLKGNRVLGLGFLINGRVRSQLPRKEVREAMV